MRLQIHQCKMSSQLNGISPFTWLMYGSFHLLAKVELMAALYPFFWAVNESKYEIFSIRCLVLSQETTHSPTILDLTIHCLPIRLSPHSTLLVNGKVCSNPTYNGTIGPSIQITQVRLPLHPINQSIVSPLINVCLNIVPCFGTLINLALVPL